MHTASALVGDCIGVFRKRNPPLKKQLEHLSFDIKGCVPVFITINEPFFMLFSSSADIKALSVICSDWDGSFLLLDTEPVIAVRVPSALEMMSAVSLESANPPAIVS